MELQVKLISLRKQKGLTQLDLADKLNLSRQAISRWEVGAAVPSTDNLKALSELYGVSLDDLLNDGNDSCNAMNDESDFCNAMNDESGSCNAMNDESGSCNAMNDKSGFCNAMNDESGSCNAMNDEKDFCNIMNDEKDSCKRDQVQVSQGQEDSTKKKSIVVLMCALVILLVILFLIMISKPMKHSSKNDKYTPIEDMETIVELTYPTGTFSIE